MEQSEHVVDFEKRSAIKSQSHSRFIANWMDPRSYTEGPVPESPWLIYCDRAGAAAILISPLGIKLRYATRLQFTKEIDKCTNNIAKYEAILLGLRKPRAIGVRDV
jgi:hypothetical protein